MAKSVRVEWIKKRLRGDPRLQSLPKLARADAEGDILTTIYLRSIKHRRKISCSYIAKTVRYYLKPQRRGDPYVEKFRRLADERQRKGLPPDESLLENQPSIRMPIDELIWREGEEVAQEKLRRIKEEVKRLGARPWAVISKLLSGEPLTHAERCVKHRVLATVKTRLSNQF